MRVHPVPSSEEIIRVVQLDEEVPYLVIVFRKPIEIATVSESHRHKELRARRRMEVDYPGFGIA
jgi:alpha-acetolactate decarboxylase